MGKENIMDGLKRAAAYAMKPNELGRCGPKDLHRVLQEYVNGEQNVTDDKIRELLMKFEVAAPYYWLIANSNKIADPFDSRVVEAYWIGNDLLDRVNENDVRQLIAADVGKNGWSPEQIAILFGAIKLKQAKPHHSLSVLYFFTFPGCRKALSPEMKNRIDSCRVCAGRVIACGEGIATVEYSPLVFNSEGEASWGKLSLKEIESGFLKNLQPGDMISFHLDYGIEKIQQEEIVNLWHYTDQTLKALYKAK